MCTSAQASLSGRVLSLALAAALLLQWTGPSLALASPAAHPIPGPEAHLATSSARYGASAVSHPVSHFLPRISRVTSLPDPTGLLTVTIIAANPTGGPVSVTEATPPGTAFDHAAVLDDGGATWFMGGLAPGQSGEFTWLTGDRVGIGTGLARSETAILALVVRPAEASPFSASPLPRSLVSPAGTLQTEATTLSIIKSDSPDPVDQGALLTYVITVTNQTTEMASQVVVTDTTPLGTFFVSANVLDGGGATWFHGGLSPGQAGDYIWFTGDRVGIGSGLPGNASAILQFVVRPVGPFPDQGLVHNDNYRVSAANAPLMPGTDVTTTVNGPTFALSKIESRDPITAGERLAYTIFLTNTGSLATSLPYTIVETLPAHTTYADSAPPAQVAGRVLTWTLTTPLGAGQAVSVTFAVTVTAPLTTGLILENDDYYAFSREVTPTVQGPAVTTTVVSWPILSISKGDDPDPVQAGDYLTYTLTVTNAANANGPALGTFVTDTLPAYVDWQNCSDGCAHAGKAVTWTLGTMQPGESRSLTLVGRVYSPLPNGTTLTNRAAVSATHALAIAETFADTTVGSAPAFVVTKNVYPNAVVAGTVVTYTIVVTNTGNETAASARITDTLPTGFNFGGMVQGDAPTQSGSDLIWSNQVITGAIWPAGWISPPGPLTLVFTATAGGSGYQYNAVTVTQGTVVAVTGPTAPVLVSAPDLRIVKVDASDPVMPGQPLAYTIVYSNASAVPATSVVVTDTLPAFITGGYANPVPDSGAIAAGQTITWNIGPLAGNSGDQSISLVVTVTLPLTDGVILTNVAGISCNEGVSAAGLATTTVRSAPALQVTKTASHDPVHPGDRVTYTIVVTNVGTANATGAVITDALPTHTAFADATSPHGGPAGGVITWTVGTLNVGASAVYTLAVTVNYPLTNGLTLTNTAWVTSTEGSNVSAEAIVTVSSQPVLVIAKADHPDPVAALGVLVYTLTFTNTGDEVATGVLVNDTLDAYTALVAASPPTDTQAGPVVGWNWGSLSPLDGPQTIVLTVTVGLVADGTILSNQVSLESDQTPLATAVETTTVRAADLVVGKWTVEPPVIGPGEQVTYTLRVTNTGSLTATGILITDTLPAGFTAVYSEAVNATWNSGTVWTANLAPGAWAAITLTAQSPFTSWGPVTRTMVNTATATTAAPEYPLTNNQSTALVDVIPGPPYTVTLVAAPDTLPIDDSSTLTATVTDQWGNPVLNGTSATFTTTLGGLSPSSGWTTANGQATAQLTSTLPGVALVTVTVDALSDTALVTFTTGAVHHFGFSPIADQVAGVNFTIAITAYDRFDNVVTGFTGTVTLSDPATGSLVPTTSDAFVNGVLASQMVSITVARVNQPIRAILGTIQSDSNPFTVTHNLAVTMSLAPQNATVTAGSTLTYTATATDAYGNPWVATSEVTFTTSGGNAFLDAPPGNNIFSATVAGVNFPITGTIAGAGGPVVATTGVTVTHGQAVSLTVSPRNTTVAAGSWVTYTAVATDTFGNGWDATVETAWAVGGGNVFAGNVLSATVAGTWPVTGTLGSVADTTAITITPGPVTALAMAPVGDPQTAGVGFGLIITATDGFGNVATNFGGGLNLTDTTGTLTPLTWSAWANGVANPTVTVFRAWVNDRITATLVATPTIFVVSNPFTVVANVPATVVYTTPASLRVCETSPVTATVTDAWGNPVTNGTVVSFTSSIGLFFSESGGQAYYTATVGNAAYATLVAGTIVGMASTWAEAGAATSGVKVVNVITPGLPATIHLAAAPTTLPIGGSTGMLTATVRDCAANPVANGTPVDWAIAPPLATIGPDPAATTNGVASAVLTSGMTVGTAVVTAVVDSLVATTTLTFVSGPAYTVTLVAVPATLLADGVSTATLTATVTDQWGNPVADGTSVDLTQSPVLGAIAPNPAATTGGIAQAIFTAGTVTGTTTITATANGRSATATVTLVVTPTYRTYLPLVVRNYGVAAVADLVVDSIVVAPANPTIHTPVVVSVTIRNAGGSAVSQPFWVDLYLDPTTPPQTGDLWNDLCTYGKAWYVRVPIPAGGTLTLDTTIPDDPTSPGDRYSNWPGALSAGAHALWAQVDSYLAPPGAVIEGNEANNVFGPQALTVSSRLSMIR